MSHTTNTIFLEETKADYEQLVSEGNFKQANKIVKNLSAIGFQTEAEQLRDKFDGAWCPDCNSTACECYSDRPSYLSKADARDEIYWANAD